MFQPNDYDNNKLLFVTWLLACGLAAEYLLGAWDRLRAGGDRPQRLSAGAAAVIFCLALFTSGAMIFVIVPGSGEVTSKASPEEAAAGAAATAPVATFTSKGLPSTVTLEPLT